MIDTRNFRGIIATVVLVIEGIAIFRPGQQGVLGQATAGMVGWFISLINFGSYGSRNALMSIFRGW
jgi:hypothetical protein